MIKSNRLLIKYIQIKFLFLAKISKKITARKAFLLFCTPFFKGTPANIVLPEIAEPLVFVLNGLTIRGFQWNNGGREKVLILHGFSSNITNFYHFVTPLVSKNFEVLAFDAPAHGASDGKYINAVLYADMIKKIAELYGPIHNYISHSFGGLAVCLALEALPAKEKTRVVLIAPATETTTAANGAFRLLKLNDNGVRKEFDKLIFNIGGRPIEWYSIKRAIRNIKASILWIHDEDDDVTPLADARKAIENYPGLNFIVTKGLGHRKIYRDPEIVKTILSFL
jgi:pimeloyl-ACP methyl ester carboxylesterase